jgi:hypothetical protein
LKAIGKIVRKSIGVFFESEIGEVALRHLFGLLLFSPHPVKPDHLLPHGITHLHTVSDSQVIQNIEISEEADVLKRVIPRFDLMEGSR